MYDYLESEVVLRRMEYNQIYPMDRADLDRLLGSGNEESIVEALLSAAYYDPDWKWVQSTCLRFLDDEDANVRWNAATCLGHIARIHGQLETEVVIPKLMSLKEDAEISASIDDAIEDIKFFLPSQ